jgi:hypothetical protein
VPPSLVIARHQWEAALRRVDAQRGDVLAHERTYADIEVVTKELRRRIGGTFSLEQLAEVYERAEDWARDILEERDSPGWPARLTLVLDAAFGLYARGALDYTP